MKVSLVTVCYNAEKTIATAMESVAAQRGEKGAALEIEYIVVDGGSTDGTVEEIRNFELRIKNEVEKVGGGGRRNFSFKWVSENDQGMYDALNKGIRMATGDVVGILNADDVLAEDDTLAKVAVAFADPELDGTFADIRFVRDAGWGPQDEGAGILERIRSAKTVRYCSGKRFRPWMFRFGTQTAHPSTFFRRECFAKWGEYSLDFGMYGDFELLC